MVSKKVLIIPNCTDLNRGDQALVLETKRIIDEVVKDNECYIMSSGNTEQCEKYGLKIFSDILKHPSRYSKKGQNVKYTPFLKIQWGLVALFDLVYSSLLLNRIGRKIICKLSKKETKNSIHLFENADYVFVKGGGFLHDYSGGLTGIYTMYYQTYHIRLALAMKKKVFIMPNSFGPFNNKISKRLVTSVLDKCQLVTSRESISSNGIESGLGRDIPLYSDLAFYLPKKNLKDKDLKKIFSKSNDQFVAITARPYRFYLSVDPEQSYLNYKKAFVKLIEHLTKKGYKVLLVVHTTSSSEHENDEKCVDEIMEMIQKKSGIYKIKNNSYDCYDLKSIYGCCKYVIGTRFHSVIFSLEQLIPCIAITYGGNKGEGIMKDIGISEYAIGIADVQPEFLIRKFDLLEKNHKKFNKKVNEYLVTSQTLRKRLISLVKELM